MNAIKAIQEEEGLTDADVFVSDGEALEDYDDHEDEEDDLLEDDHEDEDEHEDEDHDDIMSMLE